MIRKVAQTLYSGLGMALRESYYYGVLVFKMQGCVHIALVCVVPHLRNQLTHKCCKTYMYVIIVRDSIAIWCMMGYGSHLLFFKVCSTCTMLHVEQYSIDSFNDTRYLHEIASLSAYLEHDGIWFSAPMVRNIQNSIALLPYKVKIQYVQISNMIDTAIKHPTSGQSDGKK